MHIDDRERERPRGLLRGQISLKATNDTKLGRVIIICILKCQDTSERICLLFAINCFWNHFHFCNASSEFYVTFFIVCYNSTSIITFLCLVDSHVSRPHLTRWVVIFVISTQFFFSLSFHTFSRSSYIFFFLWFCSLYKNTDRCLCSLRIISVF